uniref:Multidrug and toxin extrusion protein n=1 Tax=Globisporangium ultimum (strain ATCC 200006 / CBS 805.95 / DAOM BR144) TaxID=431595 RepID=K3WE54_GLOUD
MEFKEIARDALLHKLDLPRKEHLDKTLDAARHAATVSPLLQPRIGSTHNVMIDERSPLLLEAKETDYMLAVDAILDAEEQQAVQDDDKLSTREIIMSEWRQLTWLSAPMMAAGLLDILPDMVVGIMAGNLSTTNSTHYLAALNLSNMFQMLLVDGTANGFSSAMDTLCSQAFGANRFKEMWLFSQAGVLVYLMCFPVIVLVLLCGQPILQILGQDAEIAVLTGQMLAISVLAVPFNMIYSTMKSSLQAQNIAAPFMVASLLGWIGSATGVYLLAYHTSLGFLGIALTGPIMWFVKSLVLAPVVLRNRIFQSFWPGWQFKEAFALVPKVATLGISSFLMISSQMIGFCSISFLAGLLPNAAVMISANSIYVVILSFSVMPLTAFCIAAAIRIGNSLGAGQARRASLLSRVVLVSALSMSLLAMAIMGLVASSFANNFTTDEDARREATTLIHRLMLMVPIMGLALGLQGIFRGCGKQMTFARSNFACILVVSIPCGLLLAMHFDKGVAGLWLGQMAGYALFLAASFLWLYRLQWTTMAHEAKCNTDLHLV